MVMGSMCKYRTRIAQARPTEGVRFRLAKQKKKKKKKKKIGFARSPPTNASTALISRSFFRFRNDARLNRRGWAAVAASALAL
ncbi:hypothetical protein NL676_006410 [Syzygium grande]|nr:hypothetical protein NL676_006410 [Syzygium grande]